MKKFFPSLQQVQAAINFVSPAFGALTERLFFGNPTIPAIQAPTIETPAIEIPRNEEQKVKSTVTSDVKQEENDETKPAVTFRKRKLSPVTKEAMERARESRKESFDIDSENDRSFNSSVEENSAKKIKLEQ